MSNETKKILKRRAAFAPLLMSAIMVTILIVVAGSPEATPVPRAAAATPTIKPSVNVIASVQCQGTIANTTDSTDLPNGDVDWGFGFLLGSPAAKFPAKGKPAQKVNGVFGLEIDGNLPGSEHDPGPGSLRTGRAIRRYYSGAAGHFAYLAGHDDD